MGGSGKKNDEKKRPAKSHGQERAAAARTGETAAEEKPVCNCPDDMSCIPPGEFVLGCTPGDQDCYVNERPPAVVKFEKGFCMDRKEVAQADYAKSAATSPFVFKNCGGDCPAENVTWNDALEYCQKIGRRLPGEAEWEYAARGGEPGRYYGGGDQRIFFIYSPALDGIGWYAGNSDVKYKDAGKCPDPGKKKKKPPRSCGPHPVGKLKPNGFGLYDVTGNVWEWVADCYDPVWYSKIPKEGPVNMKSGCTSHVIRGGSWQDLPVFMRVSYRYRHPYDQGDGSIGFRCAMDMPVMKSAEK